MGPSPCANGREHGLSGQHEHVRAVVDARLVAGVEEPVEGGPVVGVQPVAEDLAGAGERGGDVGAGAVGEGLAEG